MPLAESGEGTIHALTDATGDAYFRKIDLVTRRENLERTFNSRYRFIGNDPGSYVDRNNS